MHRFVKWRDLLQLAPNVKAVEAIMRDYADAIRPLVGVLPQQCQEALAGPSDIQTCAVTLLHAELAFQGSEEVRSLLHEVAHTFASAAVRSTLLHARPVVPEP